MLDKVVLIIGGSDGIGLATAKKFIKAGAAVYNGSRTRCKISGVKNITVDVSDPATINRATGRIAKEQRRLDYVIYCAGMSILSAAPLTAAADYRYLFDVNLFGAIETVKQTVPLLKQTGGGKIILLSSLAGVVPVPYEAFYNSSKAALNSLATELNIELNMYNIYVTSLVLGGVDTKFSFKRKIYTHDTGDNATLNKSLSAAQNICQIEQSGKKPDQIAVEIIKTVQKPRPDAVKIIGLKNKLSAAAFRLLPQKIALKILNRRFLPSPPPDTAAAPQSHTIPDS